MPESGVSSCIHGSEFEAVDESLALNEAEMKSACVRNFGRIEPDSVFVRNQKDVVSVSYAFVEFEDEPGVQNDIQMEPEAEAYSGRWQVQAHNICKAAVMELFTIAIREGLWDKQENPSMVVSGELVKKFQSAPSPGMIMELSVESNVFEFSPALSNITNLDKWICIFSNVFSSGYHVSVDGLEDFSSFAPELKHVQMLDVEFQIRMPFTQRRSCIFMRFHTEVNPSVWAVVDIGIDYLPVSPSHTSKFLVRRPSGLIVKQQSAGGCKVIWIENVEACKSQSNVFQILKVKSAFDANRWLTALEWTNSDKNYSLFESKPESHLPEDELHRLAKLLKVKFIRSISDTRDGRKWKHFTSNELKIFWARNTSLGVFNCLATFNLMEKPYAVFKSVRFEFGNSVGEFADHNKAAT